MSRQGELLEGRRQLFYLEDNILAISWLGNGRTNWIETVSRLLDFEFHCRSRAPVLLSVARWRAVTRIAESVRFYTFVLTPCSLRAQNNLKFGSGLVTIGQFTAVTSALALRGCVQYSYIHSRLGICRWCNELLIQLVIFVAAVHFGALLFSTS
ncbi:hypothetical protein CPB83DRAFT_452917 [Crepidotus variabilis]|uniref:Uncharacterized protein n=1 Tax=Crepidotus variabilis TaxID=179855 RepID=A0A9P6ECV3_9AGAR|nr:hypothetical protein CPB83DRAFT_452917 [Crepidotus variabilis]